jgi:large subunit ribosomal protein L2
MAGESADINRATQLPLSNIPVGTFVHNVEHLPRQGRTACARGGHHGSVMAKEGA